MHHRIKHIHADEILDSRGNPTLRVSVALTSGVIGQASVPSGASVGEHEALELRDRNPKRYGGKEVKKARANVAKIAKVLAGVSVYNQRQIDDLMKMLDGTPNKRRLGANAILGVSLACASAASANKKLPLYEYLRQTFKFKKRARTRLPYPMMNILNGGAHAGWALDIQEFMIVPKLRRFVDRVRCGAEVFHALGKLLEAKGFLPLVGDEGGYAVKLKKNEDGLRLIVQAIRAAGYKPGREVGLALDAAASELYDSRSRKYKFRVEKKNLDARGLTKLFAAWIKRYPIISLEDPLDEDAWEDWRALTKTLGKKALIVGDDLFVTQTDRLMRGIEMKAANAILIKPNQVGTLSETIDAIKLAQARGYKVIISHRSGETADTTIADLAAAVNADFIKAGSLSRSERVEKYNRLIEIEECL